VRVEHLSSSAVGLGEDPAARPDGSRAEVTPSGLADLDDNDHNHSLCLNVADRAGSVSFPAGHVVGPNGDVNPATEVGVTRVDMKELR
jgi:hypothetical protein